MMCVKNCTAARIGIGRGQTPPRIRLVPPNTNTDSLRGYAFAVSAYLLWGFLPLYMKMMAHLSPLEVLAHRVLWSVPVAGAVLWALGRTRDLMDALQRHLTTRWRGGCSPGAARDTNPIAPLFF